MILFILQQLVQRPHCIFFFSTRNGEIEYDMVTRWLDFWAAGSDTKLPMLLIGLCLSLWSDTNCCIPRADFGQQR